MANPSTTTHPQTPTSLIQTFLSHVKTKNLTSMRVLIHPEATAFLIRKGVPNFQTLDNAIETLSRAQQELVEVTWDEIEHADGDFATVWAKFSIHMDGKVNLPRV